jgi:hypothetical protein
MQRLLLMESALRNPINNGIEEHERKGDNT